MKEVIFYRSPHQQRSPGLPGKPVLRPFPASAPVRSACRRGSGGRVFRSAQRGRQRRNRLDLRPGGVPLRPGRLLPVQRHDPRTLHSRFYPLGIFIS